MTFSFNRKYIPEVDQLRAFAALLVLFYHGFQLIGARLAHGADFDATKHWVFASNPITAVIEEGHSGVGLFIVLSGFILTLGVAGSTVNYRSFLIARILRIYPMLMVCLIAAASVKPTLVVTFITSMLPFNMAGGIFDEALAGMFWAVAIEFQCYLVFPFLITFSNEKGWVYLLQVIGVAIVFRYLAVLVDGANPKEISYWTVVGRIDQFCIGIIAAKLYVEHGLSNLRPLWFLASATLISIILWMFNHLGGWPVVKLWKIWWPTIEGAMWATFIVSYLSAGRYLPAVVARVSAKIGEISYSLYLLHFAVIYLVIKRTAYVKLTGIGYYDALITTFLVVLPISLAIALLMYYTIELPFLRLRPKYIVPKE